MLSVKARVREMEGGHLAPAHLNDYDAGSGTVPSSPSLGPVTTAVHNISARHLHDLNAQQTDERQFLRAWRRQLQDALGAGNGRIMRFLVADISGAAADVSRRCNDVLAKYSRATWNFASSVRDLALDMDNGKAAATIEHEIGMAPAALREGMRRTIRMYVNAASAVAAAEGRLEEKLRRLEAIVGRVNELMFLEPTPELVGMAEPTRVYLESVLAKIDIESDYLDMVENYKRFAALRPLVSLATFQRSAGHICSICMTKEVSQALVPCGHTFCDDCAGRQQTACYVCRVQIRDKLRLFFS
jgi:hypothetical protein